MMRYLILLAALALGACSRAGESAGQRRREFGEHHRSAQRRDPDAGAAVDAIGAAAAGDPGEKHDNPYHHQIEQWLVQQLPLRRPQGSVLMEMINPSQQAQVDKVKQWLQSDPTVRDGRVAELIAGSRAGSGSCMAG